MVIVSGSSLHMGKRAAPTYGGILHVKQLCGILFSLGGVVPVVACNRRGALT